MTAALLLSGLLMKGSSASPLGFHIWNSRNCLLFVTCPRQKIVLSWFCWMYPSGLGFSFLALLINRAPCCLEKGHTMYPPILKLSASEVSTWFRQYLFQQDHQPYWELWAFQFWEWRIVFLLTVSVPSLAHFDLSTVQLHSWILFLATLEKDMLISLFLPWGCSLRGNRKQESMSSVLVLIFSLLTVLNLWNGKQNRWE